MQFNKPKQLHNKHKLTLIWSYSYDLWSGNDVAPFGNSNGKGPGPAIHAESHAMCSRFGSVPPGQIIGYLFISSSRTNVKVYDWKKLLTINRKQPQAADVVWSLEPETRMCPSGCHDRLQTIVSWASSTLPSSFSLLTTTHSKQVIPMQVIPHTFGPVIQLLAA